MNLRRVAALALVLAMFGAVAVSWAGDGVVAILLSPDLGAVAKVEALQRAIAEFGPAAPLVYLVFVTIEVVVAPLPGIALYAPGGVLFGGFWGGALSLLGNVIGAGLAFTLVRAIGGDGARRLVGEGLGPIEARLVERGTLVVFLLRVNPLTSSDLVSYAAGLTSMPVWKLLVGTLLGMAPLCWIQAYAAESLVVSMPWLLYPLAVASVLYVAFAIWLLLRWRRAH